MLVSLDEGGNLKRCSRCGEEKPITTGFSTNGKYPWCKACKAEYQRQYWKKRPGERSETTRRYYQKNTDKKRQYYLQTRGAQLEKRKRRYHEKRDELSKQSREYGRKRWEEAITKVGGCCQLCKREYHYMIYEFHHIDPKEKKLPGMWAVRSRYWNELDKCALLCAHCHRLVTYKFVLVEWGKREGLGWTVVKYEIDPSDNYQRRYHRDRQEEAILKTGGCCQCCGELKHYALYDFHHLDPTKKEMSGSRAVRRKLWSELDKCALLCYHCHRLIEFGVVLVQWEKREGLGWTITGKAPVGIGA